MNSDDLHHKDHHVPMERDRTATTAAGANAENSVPPEVGPTPVINNTPLANPVGESAPVASEPPQTPLQSAAKNFNKYILYTLVGGLVISALISVVAVLVGEFNSTMSRALATTMSMVFHTLVLLFLVSVSSKRKSSGLILNTLLTVTIASFATSVLGIWEVITGRIVFDLYAVYFYTFSTCLWAQLLLNVGHDLHDKATRITNRTAIVLTGLFYLQLLPTAFTHYPDKLPEFQYRALAATVILLATVSVLVTVFSRIYIFKHPESRDLPSVKGGNDIVISCIVLFVGLPLIFSFMAMLTSYNQPSTYDKYDLRQTIAPSSSSDSKDLAQPYRNEASERYIANGSILLDKASAGDNQHMGCNVTTNPLLHPVGVEFFQFEFLADTTAKLSTRGNNTESSYLDSFSISTTDSFTLYDDQCKKIQPSDLRSGDVVVLYTSQPDADLRTDVIAIQKINKTAASTSSGSKT